MFTDARWWSLLFSCLCRKSYRSLGLLWAGSSIAHQIVLIPGVFIGEGCLNKDCLSLKSRSVVWEHFYWWCSCVQVNTGLTFVQPFGGTSPSSWRLSGLRPCSSGDTGRCQLSQQTRWISNSETFTIFWISERSVLKPFFFTDSFNWTSIKVKTMWLKSHYPLQIMTHIVTHY